MSEEQAYIPNANEFYEPVVQTLKEKIETEGYESSEHAEAIEGAIARLESTIYSNLESETRDLAANYENGDYETETEKQAVEERLVSNVERMKAYEERQDAEQETLEENVGYHKNVTPITPEQMQVVGEAAIETAQKYGHIQDELEQVVNG